MKISKETNDAAVKFGSEALVLCDWIDTTNLVFIGGRGVAKSTVILARRSERCVRLMPGAPVAIVANTYSNLIEERGIYQLMPFGDGFGESGEKVYYGFFIHAAVAHRFLEIFPFYPFLFSIQSQRDRKSTRLNSSHP